MFLRDADAKRAGVAILPAPNAMACVLTKKGGERSISDSPL